MNEEVDAVVHVSRRELEATQEVLLAAQAWREALIPGTGSAPWTEVRRLRDAVDRLFGDDMGV